MPARSSSRSSFFSAAGKLGEDRRHRRVEHQTGETLLVAYEAAAGRILGRRVNTGEFQRHAVDDDRVPVGTPQRHRMVGARRGRVRRATACVFPATAFRSSLRRRSSFRLRRRCAFAHAIEQRRQAGRGRQVEGAQPVADSVEMHMPVAEAGDDGASCQLDHARVRLRRRTCALVVADIDDGAVADDQRGDNLARLGPGTDAAATSTRSAAAAGTVTAPTATNDSSRRTSFTHNSGVRLSSGPEHRTRDIQPQADPGCVAFRSGIPRRSHARPSSIPAFAAVHRGSGGGQYRRTGLERSPTPPSPTG